MHTDGPLINTIKRYSTEDDNISPTVLNTFKTKIYPAYLKNSNADGTFNKKGYAKDLKGVVGKDGTIIETTTSSSSQDAVKTSLSLEDKSKAGFRNEDNNNNENDNRPVGSIGKSAKEANVSGPTGQNKSDQEKEVKDIKDYGYREDAGYGLMNKGGLASRRKIKKGKSK
tara:strand:- start:76 stop:585 length:510 start_codon:yes stop_codon:yes gene_type:complete